MIMTISLIFLFELGQDMIQWLGFVKTRSVNMRIIYVDFLDNFFA
jgi:hypothetical protein